MTKRIRYLMLMLLLVGSTSLWAQDDFNPADPPEPELPAMRLDLRITPSEAGSVSGSGRYSPGKKVNVSAYGNTGFRFEKWTNAAGETVSAIQEFTYTKGERHETLTAHFVFDPDSPADPAEPRTILFFKLALAATEGGSVSGGGSYLEGSNVTLRASCDTGYDFVGWFDANGNKLSGNTTFYYTTTARHVMLTGRFVFNPSSPSEPSPSNLRPKHTLTATCNEGGSINWSSQRLMEGQSVTLSASVNSGYTFLGWFLNGELYTMMKQFSYTVSTEAVQDFEARFEFTPDSPPEPAMPPVKKEFTFTLYNKVCKAGDTIKFPVYLTTTEELHDMYFQLTFPKDMRPEVETAEISPKAVGYTVSLSEITDPEVLALPSVDENAAVYTLSFIGGQMEAGNTVLLNFTIHVDKDIDTGKGYPVRINQVSMMLADGRTITAATRNGRVSVYKRGDTNGDDVVNVIDVTNTISFVLGEPPLEFIIETADTNGYDGINVVDVTNIIDIILNGSGSSQNGNTKPVLDPE